MQFWPICRNREPPQESRLRHPPAGAQSWGIKLKVIEQEGKTREYRLLLNHARGGSGRGDYYRLNIPRRPVPYDIAVLLGADRGRNSRDADGAVGDDGSRRPWPSRNWLAWTCCARIRQAR